MEEKKIMEKLEGLEERLSNLEDELKFNKAFVDAPKNFDAKSDKKNPKTYEDTKLHTIINPRQMPVGTISFVGNFESGDGYSGSVFGGELLKFSKILENDTAEMCNILTAFASVERIDILTLKKRLANLCSNLASRRQENFITICHFWRKSVQCERMEITIMSRASLFLQFCLHLPQFQLF